MSYADIEDFIKIFKNVGSSSDFYYSTPNYVSSSQTDLTNLEMAIDVIKERISVLENCQIVCEDNNIISSQETVNSVIAKIKNDTTTAIAKCEKSLEEIRNTEKRINNWLCELNEAQKHIKTAIEDMVSITAALVDFMSAPKVNLRKDYKIDDTKVKFAGKLSKLFELTDIQIKS